MANKQVSTEVLQELTNKIQEIVNNYCWNLEYFTNSEVDDFFQASADEVTFYNGLINDKIESQNFLWSSKHVAEKIAQSIIEANGYTDNMIKNIASIKLKYVTSLPTSEISENTIYILKASDSSSKDTLNLYNATDGWTTIGDFNISLDDYYNKTEIDTKMDLKANKTEVVANDKIVQTLDSTTNSSDTVLSTSGLQTEMDKKANDDEVIKKTSLVTSIDSSSTEDTIPSSKTVYELNIRGTLIDQSVIDKYGTEIIKYPLGRWYFDSTSVARQFSDIPWGEACIIDITSIYNTGNPWDNIWSYRNYKAQSVSNKGTFVRQLESRDTAGVLADTGWQRVCTTSVADVPVTNIDLTGNSNVSNGDITYMVKNGICYVSILNVKFGGTSGTSAIPEGTFPKPVMAQWQALNGVTDFTKNILVSVNSRGGLSYHYNSDINMTYDGSFSYPVTEQ